MIDKQDMQPIQVITCQMKMDTIIQIIVNRALVNIELSIIYWKQLNHSQKFELFDRCEPIFKEIAMQNTCLYERAYILL